MNDTERDINIRKRNKEQFGIVDKKAWIDWVDKTSRLKDNFNDARLHAEEIKNIVNRQKKILSKQAGKPENLKSTTVSKRNVIYFTLKMDYGYQPKILYSDIERFSNISEALLQLDKYLTENNIKDPVVDLKYFSTDTNWKISFAEMINIDTDKSI